MNQPASTHDNPHESEIDRLLRELDIELPAGGEAGDPVDDPEGKGDVPLISDDADPADTDEPISSWLPYLPDHDSPESAES